MDKRKDEHVTMTPQLAREKLGRVADALGLREDPERPGYSVGGCPLWDAVRQLGYPEKEKGNGRVPNR